MSKAERRLVKKTILPVQVIDDAKQLNGLIHFPTETKVAAVLPNNMTAAYKKNSIMYRNQLLRENQPQEEDNRRREVQLYEVTINPLKAKQKQYKIEIPIIRGHKATKMNNKSNEVYFSFSFSHTEGKLQLLNGIQEAKMQVIVKSKNDTISKERVDRQLMSMDNRRKQQLGDVKLYEQAPDYE